MKNDGGPAFPAAAKVASLVDGSVLVERYTDGGMSLRDWLAGQALATFKLTTLPILPMVADGIAVSAYAIADAMLKERSRE